MLMLISLALLVLFVSAGPQDSANKIAEALEKGDVEGLTTQTGKLFGEVSEALQLAKIAAVGLGVIIIALIVLRLSQLISKPRVDRKKVKEENEDTEFKKMFDDKDRILEDLKAQLASENKKKKL
ncbi:MAG: hypothetical protein NUV57_01100 [archaeon]|nr:hypothetical protein [archaeon]